MSEYQQASIEHLKYSQNGGALRARFRDGVAGSWTEGWLVGWVQGRCNWVCCYESPDTCEAGDGIIDDDCGCYQYCEILTSDLEER